MQSFNVVFTVRPDSCWPLQLTVLLTAPTLPSTLQDENNTHRHSMQGHKPRRYPGESSLKTLGSTQLELLIRSAV